MAGGPSFKGERCLLHRDDFFLSVYLFETRPTVVYNHPVTIRSLRGYRHMAEVTDLT